MSSSSFLVHSQSSIEVRQFFITNFIKLLLSDYTVYGIFVWETFVIFDRLSIKSFKSTGWSLCCIKLKTIQEIKFSHVAYILYIGLDTSAVIYIFISCYNLSSFISAVLADICNCSYLYCYDIFCILIGFLQRMFLFACSSMLKLSCFQGWLSGYHIMAYLMHNWKTLKLLSMHKMSFFYFDNQGTTC